MGLAKLLGAGLLALAALPVEAAERAKIEAAVPELDRIFETFQKDSHAPGLVYGIVADGALVHVKAFGESRPLVETADGVREPQNRRVEINFAGGAR